jgi:hypothetical protein
MRALWTPLVQRRQGALDSLVRFLDQGALNLLVGDADAETVADSLHHGWEERAAVRRRWTDAVNLLQPTSVAWIPAFDYDAARVVGGPADSSRGPRGEGLAAWCALDTAFWSSKVTPANIILGRLAASLRQLVPALAMDLGRSPPRTASVGFSMGQEFCDAAWHAAVSRLPAPARPDSVPVTARYRTLLEAGLLPAYYQALEDLVAERARALRDRILKERPGLYFAFRTREAPGDWFSLGLMRGFSLPDRPLLLFTPEWRTRPLLAAYRGRGLNVVHAVELPPNLVRLRNLAALKVLVFGQNNGFWLTSGEGREASTSDSVAQALRRLVR